VDVPYVLWQAPVPAAHTDLHACYAWLCQYQGYSLLLRLACDAGKKLLAESRAEVVYPCTGELHNQRHASLVEIRGLDNGGTGIAKQCIGSAKGTPRRCCHYAHRISVGIGICVCNGGARYSNSDVHLCCNITCLVIAAGGHYTWRWYESFTRIALRLHCRLKTPGQRGLHYRYCLVNICPGNNGSVPGIDAAGKRGGVPGED
jgi:hypothetical protein